MIMRKLLFTLACLVMESIALGQSARPPFLPIWASTAIPTTDIVQPSNGFISAGWPLSSTPPSRQYFNWVLNRSTWGVDYLLHRGLADWDSATSYASGDLVIGSNGAVYRSVVGSNTGNNPTGTTLGTFWDVPIVVDVAGGAFDSSVHVANTHWIAQNYVPRGGAFSLLGGQIGNGQVPLSAVSQFQSQLSIGYGQLTGVPSNTGSVANTLALRDSSGNVSANYFFGAQGAHENPPVGAVLVNNTSDGFFRKVDFGNFQAQMALQNIGGNVTATQVPEGAVTQYSPSVFSYNALVSKTTNGCVEWPGGMIFMWGLANPNGGSITVTFPCGGFPNAIFSIVSTSTGVPTQSNIPNWNRASFTITNSGGQSFWQAVGF